MLNSLKVFPNQKKYILTNDAPQEDLNAWFENLNMEQKRVLACKTQLQKYQKDNLKSRGIQRSSSTSNSLKRHERSVSIQKKYMEDDGEKKICMFTQTTIETTQVLEANIEDQLLEFPNKIQQLSHSFSKKVKETNLRRRLVPQQLMDQWNNIQKQLNNKIQQETTIVNKNCQQLSNYYKNQSKKIQQEYKAKEKLNLAQRHMKQKQLLVKNQKKFEELQNKRNKKLAQHFVSHLQSLQNIINQIE